MRNQPIIIRTTALSLSLIAARLAGAGVPTNDDCANALPVLFEEVVAVDTSGATTDGPPALECFFNNDEIGKDIWYTFTPDTTREYRFSMCGSMYDSRLAVYDGCMCPAGSTPINCDDDFCDPGLQSEVDVVCTAGQCYLIRVGGYVSSGGTVFSGAGVLQITEAPPPPTNDLCANAIPVAVPSVTLGDSTDATEDVEFTGCDTGFISDIGVWYSVIGTGTSMVATTCGNGTDPNYDTRITVFCGGCDLNLCVEGNNDYNCTPPAPIEKQSRVSWCTTLGEEYLILVHGSLGEFGAFALEVTAGVNQCSFPLPCEFPPNDDCADAIDVTDGSTPFDVRRATTDGPEHLLCDPSNPTIEQDVWFRYTATCTGLATFTLCDSGFDTRMAIYNGFGCGDLANTILNCNRDYDCNGNGPDINDRYSQITIPVACGFEYLVRIGLDTFAIPNGGVLTISCDGPACPVACPEDCAPAGGNSIVNIDDLLAVINAFDSAGGPCDVAPVNGDGSVGNGIVNIDDLLAVINAFGPC